MQQPYRVAYDGEHGRQHPWFFPCGYALYCKPNHPQSEYCKYPGLQVELINAILRTLQHRFVAVDIGSSMYDANSSTIISATSDIIAEVLPIQILQAHNYTPTIPITYQRMVAITTSRPVDQHSNLFSFLNPFSPPVWVAILSLVVLRISYSVLFHRKGDLVAKIRSFRPSFTSSFLSITTCFMLLTGLYRNQLLSDLLIRKVSYPVNGIEDVANLPSDVRIIGYPFAWSLVLEASSGRLRHKLEQKSVLFIFYFIYFSIG